MPEAAVAQSADVSGQNNVIVQIEGDRNTVNVRGLAHLTLTRYLALRTIETDVDLLSPYTRSIPLVDRTDEVAALREWLARDKPISVRVFIGGAGTGKTRLAIELIEQVIQEGWDAGFLQGDELIRFHGEQNLSTWGWQRPTLAVIDNAAAFAEVLHGWLQELIGNPGDREKRLRLLLLERHAESDAGWWQTVFGRGGPMARAMQRLLDPNQPVELGSLAEPSVRREILQKTIDAKNSAVHIPAPEEDATFDRHLAELSWSGEPLFLMMAGLSAARSTLGNVLSLSRTDLALDRAKEELDRIDDVARRHDLSAEVLIHLAAYVTLCRGLPRDAMMVAADEEKAALGRPTAGDAARFADALQTALSGQEGRIEPILPDTIGEAVILRALEDPRVDGAAVVRRAFGRAGREVAATVIRTAQDFAATGHEQPLAWLDALIDRDEATLDELMMIADALPETSVVLAPFAVKLRTIITNNLAELAKERPDELRPSYASSLLQLGVRLSEVGRRQEALGPAQEAVDLYRALAEQAPDAYRPALAGSLAVLANCLEGNDEPQAALERNREAIDTYAPFFLAQPQAFGHWMLPMCQQYVERCEKLGQAPDPELLGPILEVLQGMQEENEQEKEGDSK